MGSAETNYTEGEGRRGGGGGGYRWFEWVRQRRTTAVQGGGGGGGGSSPPNPLALHCTHTLCTSRHNQASAVHSL